MMKAMRWFVMIGVGLTACGGAVADEAVPTVPPTAATPTTSDVAASTNVASVDTTEPATVETFVDDVVGDTSDLILAIEPVLLPDDAFPAPWEPQWRTTDTIAYGTGGNQTDCAPYWTLEEMRGGRGGGHAMWWVDGANANHYVSRLDEPVEGRFLELATLAAECPVVNWLEGGTFTVESIPVNDGLGFRLVDEWSDETTWIGVTAYGDLLSVIDIPMWVPITSEVPVEFGADDLDRLVTQMSKLLRSTPVLPSLPTTTLPGTRPANTEPPATTTPAATTITATPAPTTTTTTTTTTTLPLPSDLVDLLLQSDDLPVGFVDPMIGGRTPDEADDELVETCPAAVSIEIIDQMFTVESASESPDGGQVGQLIGRAEPAEALAVVDQFALVASCDLSSAFGEDTVTSGGSIDIEGASAAAQLTFRTVDDLFVGDLVLVAVDDVISVVNYGVSGDGFEPGRATALAERAVERILAGSAG